MSDIKDFELEIDETGKATEDLPAEPVTDAEEVIEEGVELSMDEMDEIAGGLHTRTDYYVTRYCPYCKKSHKKIAKCKESFTYKKKRFPLYWCNTAKHHWFVASNGCFDQYANKIDSNK